MFFLYAFVAWILFSPLAALFVARFIAVGKGPGLVGPGTEHARQIEQDSIAA